MLIFFVKFFDFSHMRAYAFVKKSNFCCRVNRETFLFLSPIRGWRPYSTGMTYTFVAERLW